MNELDTMKGLLPPGAQYSANVNNCVEFTTAIADVQRKDIKEHLAQCNYLSVIVDGSIDSSTTDNEMVYIQSCKGGVTMTNFISCCQVERGVAPQIMAALQRATETVMGWDVFKRKLVALGSDGASVMLGKNNGVIALLKAIQPATIAVHCSAHRLELAYKDTIKKVPIAEKVTTLLTGLYYMHGKSALNRTNLKNAFRCLGMKILLPTRAGGTRWVGHTLTALGNFLIGYKAIRLHLEQLAASTENSDSKSKAIGFLKLIKSCDVISMALFLQDVLTVLQKVSLKFQEKGSVVADVSLTIKTTFKRIESFITNNVPSFHKLAEYEQYENTAGPAARQTFNLTGGDGSLINERKKLIEMLCKNMKVRFEDTGHQLIHSTSIANFKMWPDKEEELEGYEDEMVKEITEHYSKYFVEEQQVYAEWPLLRNAIFEAFGNNFETLTWHKVNRRFGREYPHALSLFDLILSIPATSAACE